MFMFKENIKILAFEYFIYQIANWYKEKNNGDFENNDLSKLKLLKLHFFVCASRANEEEDGLLGLFDNFWAMPYGHVESDIYVGLNDLKFSKINNQKLELKDTFPVEYFSSLEDSLKEQINLSISAVKNVNSGLINYMAVDLVELSHTWYSWKSMYKLARSFKKYSLKIPKEMIKSEKKIYFL